MNLDSRPEFLLEKISPLFFVAFLLTPQIFMICQEKMYYCKILTESLPQWKRLDNARKQLKMLIYRQVVKGKVPLLSSKISYFRAFFSPSKTISNYNIEQLLINTICTHF